MTQVAHTASRGGLLALALAAAALGSVAAAPAAHAARAEVINGATCIPYPKTSTSTPYQHWLYGFGGSAFCHLTFSNDDPVTKLSYVLFKGMVNAGSLTARLCIHSGGLAVSCGKPKTLGVGSTVSWVAPPSPLPADASGAYLKIDFPTGVVSTLFQVQPVWN